MGVEVFSYTGVGGSRTPGETKTALDLAIASVNGAATSVVRGGTLTFALTSYDAFSTYSVSASAGLISIDGDEITYTAPDASDDTVTVVVDGVSRVLPITILPGVATPTLVSPSLAAADQHGAVRLTASAFATVGMADTHVNSDWQIAADTNFANIVAQSLADTAHLTSCPLNGLSPATTYYWRVRYRGTNGDTSAWSSTGSFVTKAANLWDRAPGGQGFGVDAYVGTLPSGFSAKTGSADPTSDNWGNYFYGVNHTVYLRKGYLRIGSPLSPRYATFGDNAHDYAGVDTFADQAHANENGYFLHRAFIDGGAEQNGFFRDKYKLSKDGTGLAAVSVPNAVPISLTNDAAYTNSAGMTGCTGILADAITLARARGTGWHNQSIWERDWIARLSLCHGQAATSATYCAWYDSTGTKNYPRGCDNNALGSTDDAAMLWVSAGDSGAAAKPKTGSANYPAKAAHNGQLCGSMDDAGMLWECLLGITAPGASATDSTQRTDGTVWTLKQSASVAALTAGWNGATDAFQSAANIGGLYEQQTDLLPWGSAIDWQRFGNGANQVFAHAASGADWLRTCSGVATGSGLSSGGINLFGIDGCYRYNRANVFSLAGAYWNNGSSAGLFARFWYYSRAGASSAVGARAAAYG